MAHSYPKPSVRKPPRIDLKPIDFDNLIEDQGVRVRITPAILCPRRSGEVEDDSNYNHDLNCPLCSNGIIDVDSKAQEDWAFIQGLKFEELFDPASRFDFKDAFITTKSQIRLSYWYKIEIIDFACQFNQFVLRSSSNKDRTRYVPVKVQDISTQDTNIFCVIDENNQLYTLGTHYDVSGREITWLGATRPPAGRLYSFLYPVLPTFRVLDFMHENRYYYNGFKRPDKVPVQLPQQAHIRSDFFIKGGGSDIPRS